MSNILDKSVLDSKDYNDPNSVLYRGVLKGNVLENKDSKTKDLPQLEAEILLYRTDPQYLTEYTNGDIDPITGEEKKYPPAARVSFICAVYTDYSDYYDEVHWLQTIETDYREDGQAKEFIDEGDYGIFYDQSENYIEDTEEGFFREGQLYNMSKFYNFSDFPSRPADRKFYWLATLSLVGVNPDGSLEIITTIRWGYGYNKNRNDLYLNPKKVEFEPKRISKFHLDVIKNPQKYRK